MVYTFRKVIILCGKLFEENVLKKEIEVIRKKNEMFQRITKTCTLTPSCTIYFNAGLTHELISES